MMKSFFEKYNYSKKQVAFIIYLLKRLGFTDNNYTRKYVKTLINVVSIHNTHEKEYDLITYLLEEYNFKRKREYKILKNFEGYTSATDLANYAFCPVAYSISKSFSKPTTKLESTGTSLHQESHILKMFSSVNSTYNHDFITKHDEEVDKTAYKTSENKDFFNDLKTSRLIYSGHQENQIKYFINQVYGFVGQPDYIFENKDGNCFMVEEKFKYYYKQNIPKTFYLNHKVQLASYIYYLNQFSAKYGYLVYWIYSFEKGGGIFYDKCLVTRISKNEVVENYLTKVYNRITGLKKNKSIYFNPNELNPVKCASCMHNMYCGHKTKKIKQVKIPYQRYYHKIASVPFPEILKKE